MPAVISSTPSDLAAALRQAGLTDVDDSLRRRAEYSTDASLYRVVPQAVAFPRAVDQVIAALDVCRSLGVPLTARGAGTSVAGNAVGTGLVLDFSRHLAAVRAIDPHAATATIEPGIVLADLQRAAKPYGLRFGPDPSTHNRCTLGGMIGNNACGSRALGYGRTSDNVAALDLLTGTGERSVTRRSGCAVVAHRHWPRCRASSPANLDTIRTELGRFGRQVSGYSLEHLLPERRLRRRPGAGRHRGHARDRPRRDGSRWSGRRRRRCWSRSDIPTWPRPPTRYPRCCRSGRSRVEGLDRADRRRGPCPSRAGRGPRPSTRRRLAVRRTGRRRPTASWPPLPRA